MNCVLCHVGYERKHHLLIPVPDSSRSVHAVCLPHFYIQQNDIKRVLFSALIDCRNLFPVGEPAALGIQMMFLRVPLNHLLHIPRGLFVIFHNRNFQHRSISLYAKNSKAAQVPAPPYCQR